MITFIAYLTIACILVTYFTCTEEEEPEFKRVVKCFAWPLILFRSLIKWAFKAVCFPFKMIGRLV